MYVKRVILYFMVLSFFAYLPALANPQKILEQWEVSNDVERELILIATEGLKKSAHAREGAAYELMQKQIASVLAKVKDPAIVLRVAHNLLSIEGSTDDRVVNEVQNEAFFACINRVSEIRTKDALERLKSFRSVERLDGGSSIYVDEAISRLEKEIPK